MVKAYKELNNTRIFNENIDPSLLKWHRDPEDRFVKILKETNWQIQFDNSTPKKLNKTIFIPKNTWHRIIKGTNDLITEVIKLNEETYLDSTIIEKIGLQGKAKLINAGSFAKIYQDPTNKNRIIKITKDSEDATNIINAQKLNSENIVKLFDFKKLDNKWILILEYVKGPTMVYTSAELLALMEGKNGMEDRKNAYIKILNPDPFRQKILENHNKFNNNELKKLSSLFKTIYQLENQLDIFLADFTDNIIDNNQYVIIDLGL